MRSDRLLTFAAYEIRRAIARKKVLALVGLTILLDTAPYYALAATQTSIVPEPLHPYLWIVGVFVPQALFLQFIALLIAAGSMSEEYEQGTAELLLSKPVGREEYFFGKFLGGYTLVVAIVILNATLSIASATFLFGPQTQLGVLPVTLAAQAFSALVFFSFAFMIGELIRRSSLSYILSSAAFFSSQILGIYLNIIYNLTGDDIYRTANLYLPTSPVDSLPILLASPSFPGAVLALFRFGGAISVETSVPFSVTLIAAYSLSAIILAIIYFRRADVARRVT